MASKIRHVRYDKASKIWQDLARYDKVRLRQDLARYDKVRFDKIGKARFGKIWQSKIRQDLARYDKVRLGKIWQDMTR